MSNKIAQVVVGLPVEGPFDYAVPSALAEKVAVGQRVRVLFNRHLRMGIVTGFKSKSAFTRLNPVLSCLDNLPVFDERSLKVTREVSACYACSWGEAMETWLPAALRTTRSWEGTPPPSVPADEAYVPKNILLHDKTLEKRWPFILETVRTAMNAGRSVIFLVPEAILIQPVLGYLQKSFSSPVAILDRSMPAARELINWGQVREGKAGIVVGTRSAVFAPAAALGLIVVYDEENPAYKQEQTPHYQAHAVARIRARIENCSLLYVSSAPSAETWAEARKKKWQKVTLEPERVSTLQVVDMTNYNPAKTSILSFPLQNAIRATLEQQGKVILLMNRKGFTTRTRCQQCGFTLKCERCNVNLTYLYSRKIMVCRHCNFQTPLPRICPQCQSGYLRSTGTGTEKLESEVARLYPQARVGRYDTASKAFPAGADIVIATKALLREHDPRVDVIGVVNFDAELHHLDFRSGHHAFALLVRLRQLATEKLLVQTRMADNYCLRGVLKNNFEGFYRKELALRRELGFPPYKHLVAVRLRGVREDLVFAQAQEIFDQMGKNPETGIEISDPHPDVNPKLRDRYRFTILLKGPSVKRILDFVRPVLKNSGRKAKTLMTVDVDP